MYTPVLSRCVSFVSNRGERKVLRWGFSELEREVDQPCRELPVTPGEWTGEEDKGAKYARMPTHAGEPTTPPTPKLDAHLTRLFGGETTPTSAEKKVTHTT